jgi:hypothetical protein
MSEEAKPAPDPPGPPPPRCINLMCKAMLVFGEAFEMDPDYQAGMTDFWCQCTQKPYGPDNNELSLPLCSDPKRSCYQAY